MKKIISIGLLLLVIGCTKKNLNECGTIVKMEKSILWKVIDYPYITIRVNGVNKIVAVQTSKLII